MSKRKQQQAQLQQQLATLVESVEALLAAEVDTADQYYLGLKAQAELALLHARESLAEGQQGFFARTKQRACRINHFVTEQPWSSVALGWAAGIFCGIVIAKR